MRDNFYVLCVFLTPCVHTPPRWAEKELHLKGPSRLFCNSRYFGLLNFCIDQDKICYLITFFILFILIFSYAVKKQTQNKLFLIFLRSIESYLGHLLWQRFYWSFLGSWLLLLGIFILPNLHRNTHCIVGSLCYIFLKGDYFQLYFVNFMIFLNYEAFTIRSCAGHRGQLVGMWRRKIWREGRK